ncbi:hypothetical protein ACNKHV_00980 [Shigella flexneri]
MIDECPVAPYSLVGCVVITAYPGDGHRAAVNTHKPVSQRLLLVVPAFPASAGCGYFAAADEPVPRCTTCCSESMVSDTPPAPEQRVPPAGSSDTALCHLPAITERSAESGARLPPLAMV